MKEKIKELKNLCEKKLGMKPIDADRLIEFHDEFIIDCFLSGMSPLDLCIKFPNWDEVKVY